MCYERDCDERCRGRKVRLYLIVFIEFSGFPMVVWQTHSPEVCSQIHDGPAFFPFHLVLFRVIEECIEFIELRCNTQKDWLHFYVLS